MLHNVDKHNLDRSNPNPNTHDTNFITNAPIIDTPRQAHSTISTSYQSPATNLKQRIQMLNSQIVGFNGSGQQTLQITPFGLTFSDGSNIRLLAGLDSTGNEVVKVSRMGYDATTATGSQLIFNSNNDLLQVIGEGFVSVGSGTCGGGLTTTRSNSISYAATNTPLIITNTPISGLGSYSFQGIVPLSTVTGFNAGVTLQCIDNLSTTVTSTGATFQAIGYNGSGANFTFPSYTIAYYVLQQSN
jgi:hypothetical protein